MAAGDLPAHVASGELITSAWGNSVVDELLRDRNETFGQFDHPGQAVGSNGVFDIGTTNLGPFAFPTRLTIWATYHFGNAGMATNWALDLFRLLDNAIRATPNPLQANIASAWVSASLSWSFAVPAGSNAGFKTRATLAGLASGTASFAAFGIYHIQRTGTP